LLLNWFMDVGCCYFVIELVYGRRVYVVDVLGQWDCV
jgi:hypothetical protein